MMPNEAEALQLRSVCVSYPAGGADGTEARTALHHIDLDIRPGERLRLVGRNGSGKSTLGRIIAGLQPPSSGTVRPGWTDGLTIRSVMQHPDAQIVGQTVMEDCCFGMENAAIPPAEMADRAKRALALVGLLGLADHPSDRLSGGQKQLLAIAGCLAVGARLLVFDEATSMLDPAARLAVVQIAAELERDGTAIVWITQRMEELATGDRVIALDEGSVVFDGDCRQFVYGENGEDRSPCRRLGLVPPYAVQVAEELRARGIRLPGPPVTLRQLDDALAAVGAYGY